MKNFKELIIGLLTIVIAFTAIVGLLAITRPYFKKGITIKTICVYEENKVEEIKGEETESHNCYFLKELKGSSSDKEYFLWNCDEGLKLYYFYK